MQRSRLAVLLFLPLAFATGCPNPPCKGTDCDGSDAGLDAGTDAGTDAGIVDTGDFEASGPYANCHFLPGSTGTQCGALPSFDLSGCPRTTLGGAGQEGVFTTHLRADLSDGGVRYSIQSHSLRNDGGVETFNSWATLSPTMSLTKQFTNDTWFVSRFTTSRLSDGGTSSFTWSYAGCSAQDANHVTGCYVTCRDGQSLEVGTFETARIVPARNESEANGLTLVSESPVVDQYSPDYTFGMPVDVYVTKSHAYVVSLENAYMGWGGLTVFDVSDPANPRLVNQISAENGYWNGVWAKGDALYVASGKHGVITFDISNPANPVLTPVQVQEDEDAHTVFVEGNHLYAMGAPTRIYDISDPRAPRLLGRYEAPGSASYPYSYVHDAFVYQGRMYSYYWSYGMQISDVSLLSDEQGPVPLGAYRYGINPDGTPMQSYARSHAGAVGTYVDRLIAFEGGETWGAHLRVLDVTDPTQVKLISRYRLREEASIHNMILDEARKRLYIAYYHEGVRVLDVANPTQPREIAYYNNFRSEDPLRGLGFYEGAIGIRVPKVPDVTAVNAGLLYVVDTSRGLLILRETK
ncbi:LVIVD repeat-containing protein [Archangium violaceum]|uniref:LVIVD repeat-containing protein n=1 Tax=Archangium violaceum TaxID=83451 RepID=UPI0036DC9A49